MDTEGAGGVVDMEEEDEGGGDDDTVELYSSWLCSNARAIGTFLANPKPTPKVCILRLSLSCGGGGAAAVVAIVVVVAAAGGRDPPKPLSRAINPLRNEPPSPVPPPTPPAPLLLLPLLPPNICIANQAEPSGIINYHSTQALN